MTSVERDYAALAYDTVTGRVARDLKLAAEPEWAAVINDAGSWKITVPLDGGELTRQVREWCVPDKISVAVLRGAEVLQAGPITPYQPAQDTTDFTVSGKGIWDIFDRRTLHNAAFRPQIGQRLTDPVADVNLQGTLPLIAREIVNHQINMSWISGSNLPIDLPDIPAGGTNVRNYHGYDIVPGGQRLRELTQVDGGPDVLFQPYLATVGGVRYIRHRMLIGNPWLTQPGVDLKFFYRRTLTSLDISGGVRPTATRSFVKGSGNEAGQLYGTATADPLIAAGWPLTDDINTNHTDASVQSTLDSWASASLALASGQAEQWQATVLADADPKIGSYVPGHFVTYSVTDHHWLPDGGYRWRLIGMSRGGSTPRDRVDHQLQAVRAG
ncbi:hypothetical protein [Amycolatopsis rubida]|uniref:Uncharacterized protein n=1 Tax=Amycolatopsis rubida TaxID=112413 RepID=A0A1I5IH88_9PSEU|nr:hypothetical protein [Amycolatopsis rubida]SFO59570.1 hypothetical protein SAMN05421854_102454 [Amycolatopsis rubida]